MISGKTNGKPKPGIQPSKHLRADIPAEWGLDRVRFHSSLILTLPTPCSNALRTWHISLYPHLRGPMLTCNGNKDFLQIAVSGFLISHTLISRGNEYHPGQVGAFFFLFVWGPSMPTSFSHPSTTWRKKNTPVSDA